MFQRIKKKFGSELFENVKYCKLLMLGVAVICLIFIFSVADESSYCCVSLGNKKSLKFVLKVKSQPIIGSNFVNHITLTTKVKQKFYNKKKNRSATNRLKFETISLIEI